MKFLPVQMACIVMALVAFLTFSFPIAADANPDGAMLFENTCAGCHVNGGNIIRRGKNLQLKTLQKNGVDSVEAIAQIIANGKGIMSAYSDRLNAEEIEAIALYVMEQAQQGWQH